jgi:hypothetical protein
MIPFLRKAINMWAALAEHTLRVSLCPLSLGMLSVRPGFIKCAGPDSLLKRHGNVQALLGADQVIGVLGIGAQVDLHPVDCSVEFAA